MVAVTSKRTLRVCIETRLGVNSPGGVRQVVIGLASALSRLDDGPEKYIFVVDPAATDWIRPYVSGQCSLQPAGTASWRGRARRHLRQLPHVADFRRRLAASYAPARLLLSSDGTVEAAAADVVHFVSQGGFRTRIPSMYQLHDLQHIHLPEFFTHHDRSFRDVSYRALARQATKVIAMTEWGARDIAMNLGVSGEKLAVVPWASVLDAYGTLSNGELARIRSQYALPRRFALYPAQTWPHKNHLRLLEALAQLRDQDIVVPLIAIGAKNDSYPLIERRTQDLGLQDSVRFLGFVDESVVGALYRLAHCLVFPSLFEGWGLPVTEALAAELPVACADLPVLREQAGDACLWFDPTDVRSIAKSLRDVWVDEATRRRLASIGHVVADRYSWSRTARTFRALYREIAGSQLTTEDYSLLEDAAFAGRSFLEPTG